MSGAEHLVSYFVAYIAWGAVPLALFPSFLRRAVRYRHLTQRAQALERGSTTLTPGETILVGTLVREGPAPVAIEVEQTAHEVQDSGEWSYFWESGESQTRAEPFLLELKSGERIRVEPNSEVVFGFPYRRTKKVGWNTRLCVAELEPGARIYARGNLVRGVDAGYRGMGTSWILRPPRGHPMLLSPLPISGKMGSLASRMRAAAGWCLGGVIVMALLNLPFHRSVGAGHVIPINSALVLIELVALAVLLVAGYGHVRANTRRMYEQNPPTAGGVGRLPRDP